MNNDPQTEVFSGANRSHWMRLRTLANLRWVAIAGQSAAVLIASYGYGFQFAFGPAVMTIGASVLLNLFLIFLFPETRRLRENEAALTILFDLVQLGLLLYLTGGLNNPFALLILAPVTIAATALPLRSILALGALAIVEVSLLAFLSLDLRDPAGLIMSLPGYYTFGFWAGLVIGIVFLAAYARRVTQESRSMSEALVATQMALAREQKLTDLGGVVAAAAHELGTPLATIKLVSAELMDELEQYPELREDAALIRQQADRCRDILQSMGRAGKSDEHFKRLPLETVVREAAEPHLDRHKSVEFLLPPSPETRQPIIQRRPEIVHGLRNLIQNAVDFADAAVRIDIDWSQSQILLRISDDGPGFPASIIGRIGDPFVRRRKTNEDRAARPGYEGMGLGLFIAKTLLERSGATLGFVNGGARGISGQSGGAIVSITWPRSSIEAEQDNLGLGDNQPIERS